MSDWPTLEQFRAGLIHGTGRNIKVAILDSGIEAAHPRLHGLALADDLAVVEEGFQIKVIPGAGQDVFGHGTAIADIIHQVAPAAQVGSFRVLGPNLRSRSALIAEGVRQALDRGYQIVNCSFGCGREDQVLLYKDWIDEAYVRGRHIVAACNNDHFSRREWPGHFPTVITVNFCRGACAETFYYRPGTLVEFAARGQDVEVAWAGGGQKQVTGSSFAAPHVAGLLARMLSHAPDTTPLQAKALLQQLAEPWPGVAA